MPTGWAKDQVRRPWLPLIIILKKSLDSLGFLMKQRYCKFAFISLNKGLLESEAWNELTRSQIQVFIYIWSCLRWSQLKKKSVRVNNGDIEISMEKMRVKLGISKATCSNAVHKLIEVGLIRLTRVGQNKICHMYKVLYSVVPQNEERWRKYPEKNWKHECPSSPNNLVGKDTRFKSHPKELDRKLNNQTKKLD